MSTFWRVSARVLKHPKVEKAFAIAGALGAIYLVLKLLHPRIREMG